MFSFILVIITINLDALSFGISTGLKNAKIKIKDMILVSIFSTMLFFIPFSLSKYIFKIFNKNICNILNGIMLIVLGMVFILKKENKEKIIKNYFLETIIISIDAIITAIFFGYEFTNHILYTIFYLIINYLFIFLGNRIFYKFSDNYKVDFSIISGLIFVTLGALKIFGI